MTKNYDAPSIVNDFSNKSVSGKLGLENKYGLELLGEEYDKRKILEYVSLLEKSDRGRELLEAAAKNKTQISISYDLRSKGSYNDDKNLLLLNPNLSNHEMVCTFAHELRHAEQFHTFVDLKPGRETPVSYLGGMFAIEADASTHAALVVYELKEKGISEPLDKMLEGYPYIVEPFVAEAAKGKDFIPSALQAGFLGWYDGISKRVCYESNYSKMLDYERNNHSKENRPTLDHEISPEETVKRTCVYNGQIYFKENPELIFDEKHLSMTNEPWWNTWRMVRDFGVDKSIPYMEIDKEVNRKMAKMPRRISWGNENNEFAYSVPKEEPKPVVPIVLDKLKNSR